MIVSERRLLQPFIALCALISLVQSYPMLAEVPEETQQVRFASRGTCWRARGAKLYNSLTPRFFFLVFSIQHSQRR